MPATRTMTRPSPHQWVCALCHGARARDCLRLGSRPKRRRGGAGVPAAMLPVLTPISVASTSRRAVTPSLPRT